MRSAEIREGVSVGLRADSHKSVGMLNSFDTVRNPPGVGSSELKIPGYEILSRIHDGAMGTVFKARQLSVDRIVAIKVLGARWARDADHAERFCRESLIAAQLLHPNIVATIDAGVANGRPYLIMEYVQGLTLLEFIEQRGICDETTALRIALDIAGALRFLNQRGLTHRDIKPANIIVTPEGVKLIDLGLARPLGDETWAVAEAGMAVGTPEYISPEQTRGQSDLDVRSDLYSLGATLFHLVTGRVPYGGTSVAEAMHRHASAQIPLPAPESLNNSLTSGLGAIVRKLMAWTREDRYRSPDDLIFDLTRMLRGARPLIADFAPDALAPLAVGEAQDARRTDVGVIQPNCADDVPVPIDDFMPNWVSLLLFSALTLSLVMTAAVLVVVSG